MSSKLLFVLLISGLFLSANAQEKAPAVVAASSVSTDGPGPSISSSTSPADLAKAALEALGGEKYRNMKSLVVSGSADLYAPNQTQSLPAKFVLVSSGDRMRLEVQSAIFSFRQIYDGATMYTSIPGFDLPPPNRYGLPVLLKAGLPGYTITAIPDRKKLRGFKVTDGEGLFTDFYIDPQTAQVVSFESEVNGLKFGVEHKRIQMVEGVMVPFAFVQRLATSRGDYFVDFKVKDARVNQEIAEDVFQIPAK